VYQIRFHLLDFKDNSIVYTILGNYKECFSENDFCSFDVDDIDSLTNAVRRASDNISFFLKNRTKINYKITFHQK